MARLRLSNTGGGFSSLITSGLASALLALGTGAAEWEGWKCNDLTPDLCDLRVENGTVSVRGISVRYWKYYKGNRRLDREQKMAEEGYHEKKKHLPDDLPVIMINGGPSWTHSYMLPLRQIACRGNREVIFYDQGGCGESMLPTAGAEVAVEFPWLLDPSYYAKEELPALISHLGYDEFHIVGHSWGTMVAQLFALDGPAEGLRSLVLSGPISDAHLMISASWEDKEGHGGMASMPPYLQSRIRAIEAQEAWDSPEYEALDNAFLNMFLTRVQPLPDCVAASLAGMNVNIYLALFGPDDFSIGGALKDFNTTGRLHEIDVPVLLSIGEYDFVRPASVNALEENLPVVERVTFSQSAHNSMQDEAGSMNDVVSDFLGRVENHLVHKKKYRTRGDGKWNLLTSVLPINLSTGGRRIYAINNQSVLVMATTFLFGLMLGIFINKRQVHRPGYMTL